MLQVARLMEKLHNKGAKSLREQIWIDLELQGNCN